MTAYTVSPGTQIHHHGTTHGEGDTVHADPEQARMWLAAGWATETTGAKAVHRDQAEDKATTPRRRSPRS